MHSTMIISALVATLSLVAATPLNIVERGTPGGIYLCTGPNYTGQCGYAVQKTCPNGCRTASDRASACVILTAPWVDNIGSFGPDQGATVYLSSNNDCNEADTSISYPGSGDFKNYNGGEGRKITSFLVIKN